MDGIFQHTARYIRRISASLELDSLASPLLLPVLLAVEMALGVGCTVSNSFVLRTTRAPWALLVPKLRRFYAE